MLRANFNGTPFIGVFADATESSLLITPEIDTHSDIIEELEVDNIYSGTIAGSTVLGSMVVGNTDGYAVSPMAREHEIESLRDDLGVKVEKVPGRLSAIGNLVLANDEHAVVSEELNKDAVSAIQDVLDVEIKEGTIAGLDIVGSAGLATNKGILVHANCKEEELMELENYFDLPVDVGTVNYGTPLIGSGLIANSKGYVVGSETTGPELGRIEETLGYI